MLSVEVDKLLEPPPLLLGKIQAPQMLVERACNLVEPRRQRRSQRPSQQHFATRPGVGCSPQTGTALQVLLQHLLRVQKRGQDVRERGLHHPILVLLVGSAHQQAQPFYGPDERLALGEQRPALHFRKLCHKVGHDRLLLQCLHCLGHTADKEEGEGDNKNAEPIITLYTKHASHDQIPLK